MPRKISEDQTRKQMIDPQLEHAGWYLHGKLKAKKAGRQFENTVSSTAITLIKFAYLCAVQSVLLQKRHLETADLYEPPLDMFGADAVERWFTEKEVNEIVEFTEKLAVKDGW